MSSEQFKRLKIIKLVGELPVKFELRPKMTMKQREDEKNTHEALDKVGLIYESISEVKQEDLRVEGGPE